MAFYEFNPMTPDEDHPAIIEHRISAAKDGTIIRDSTAVISLTGHETEAVNPRDAFGFEESNFKTTTATDIGELALVGARRYE